MKVKFGEAVHNGFKYATLKDRLAVWFVYTLAYMLALIYPIYWMFSAITTRSVGSIVSAVVGFLGVLLVFGLIGVWITLAYVQDYKSGSKKGGLWKAFTAVKAVYWRMVAVSIIVSIISGVLSSVEYVGWLLSFIISWIFLFIGQFVVIQKKKFGETFTASWKNIRKYPWETILVWLVNMVICMGIVILAMLPFMAALIGLAFPLVEGNIINGLLSVIQANLVVFIVMGLIAVFGFAICSVFSLGMTTDAFLQIYKKKK